MRAIFLIFLCLVGCQKKPSFTRHPIQGREEVLPSGKILRRPLYQVKVPVHWQRVVDEEAFFDETKPNASFQIEEGVILHLHSFPTDRLEERIAPATRVAREAAQITPIRHDGFFGVYFETPTTMAWSFGLDPELYETLACLGRTYEEKAYFRQMRSDFTIRVSGPADRLAKHREEIFFFVDSLELFQAIPKPANF